MIATLSSLILYFIAVSLRRRRWLIQSKVNPKVSNLPVEYTFTMDDNPFFNNVSGTESTKVHLSPKNTFSIRLSCDHSYGDHKKVIENLVF